MIKYLVAFTCFLNGYLSVAQDLSGKVVNGQTSEGIPFATVYIKSIGIGATCDFDGCFKLKGALPEHFVLEVSAATFETKEVEIVGSDSVIIQLKPITHYLNEIVVYVEPGIMRKSTTSRVDRIAMNELRLVSPTSVVDALTTINGVQQVSAGMSSPKPVIRGMQGMRVVTLLNGMRLENQQWGGDHGLGISQLGVGSAEVIKGPAGIIYAGDALGGVVYLEDQNFASQGRYQVTLNSQFESVNLGFTNSVFAQVSPKNVRFSFGALSSNAADFKTTNGGFLADSRFQDHGMKFGLGAHRNNWNLRVNYLFSRSVIGIPGHTHDSLATADSYLVDTQERTISLPHQFVDNHFLTIENNFRLARKQNLKLQLSHGLNDFAEFEEKVSSPEVRMILNSTNARLQHDWFISNKLTLLSGIQSGFQSNKNKMNALETLLPNSEQFDLGAYSLMKWALGPFHLQAALRVDHRQLTTTDFVANYTTPNGSLGASFEWYSRASHTLRVNLSSGSRAPHISELTADGPHHGAARYEKGDRNLAPERATQLDVDYQIATDHITFVVNPFFTYLQDYIQLAATDSVIDELDVYEYSAVDQARLYGVDVSVHYHPHFAHNLHLESGYSIIYGESFDATPLYLMPQPRLRSKAKFNNSMKKKFGISGAMMQHQYFFAQDRIGLFETTSKAYHLIDAAISVDWKLNSPIYFTIGVRNALGATYVNHLSRLKQLGLTEPGRSIYVTVKFQIQGKLRKDDLYDHYEILNQ